VATDDRTPLPAAPRIVAEIAGRAVPLEPDRIYVVGNHERTDLRLSHASISPHHATLSFHDGRVLVEDLASVTGTWIAGERVTHAAVDLGTPIRVGDIDIRVRAAMARPLFPPVSRRSALGRPGESFAELMAEELRRVPWFTLSALLHALILWLLWLLIPDDTAGRTGEVAVAVTPPGVNDVVAPPDDPAEEAIEIQEPVEPPVLAELPLEANPFSAEDQPDDPAAFQAFAADLLGPHDSMFAKLRGGGGVDDILKSAGGRSLSGGFKKTVGGLRESGLEIVFVFDSTSSMDPVIQSTRESLARMLEVLHALVPESRVGAVTYRDNGRYEEYLTRSVPLGQDFYRSINFVHSVRARGGGDRPEAVFEALEVAVQQNWQRGARRVIVLVGDAPPHHKSESQIEKLVRNFTRDNRSFVHAIMTPVDEAGRIEQDTLQSFGRIAEFGRGACLPLEKGGTILRQVLSLAIGNEFRQSIDDVYDLVARQQKRVPARFLDIVRRADRAEIERHLTKEAVSSELVEALARSKNKAVAVLLVELLRRERLPDAGRQAAAYALQRLLELAEPPIRPDRPGTPDEDTVRGLADRLRAWPN
jgi:hypothetical protein